MDVGGGLVVDGLTMGRGADLSLRKRFRGDTLFALGCCFVPRIQLRSGCAMPDL